MQRDVERNNCSLEQVQYRHFPRPYVYTRGCGYARLVPLHVRLRTSLMRAEHAVRAGGPHAACTPPCIMQWLCPLFYPLFPLQHCAPLIVKMAGHYGVTCADVAALSAVSKGSNCSSKGCFTHGGSHCYIKGLSSL